MNNVFPVKLSSVINFNLIEERGGRKLSVSALNMICRAFGCWYGCSLKKLNFRFGNCQNRWLLFRSCYMYCFGNCSPHFSNQIIVKNWWLGVGFGVCAVMVRDWFGMLSESVRCWFGHGSAVVRYWFLDGSAVVRWWLGHGSAVVSVFISEGFGDGSVLVSVGFGDGSEGKRFKRN